MAFAYHQQQQPQKSFYLDHFGNMSTSSCISTNNSLSISSGSSSVIGHIGGGRSMVRKQILPLKPKQAGNFVQRLENKVKKFEVPVTTLELKKDKQKLEKNNIITLTYRKPPVKGIKELLLPNQSHSQQNRRPGSPSSSGYETDSFADIEQQENCEDLSLVENWISSCFISEKNSVTNHGLDMLHSHPVWGPSNNLYQF